MYSYIPYLLYCILYVIYLYMSICVECVYSALYKKNKYHIIIKIDIKRK